MATTVSAGAGTGTGTIGTTLKLRYSDSDDLIEVGVDEAGRGCFWGPIMAGAVIWPPVEEWTEEHRAVVGSIKDSKKIAPKKREKIADEIRRLAQTWAVGSVSAKEIDENGITWANQEAFRRAITGLKFAPERLIIDGELSIYGWEGEQHTVVDGDATYLHIAAASILAKVDHDRWVQGYCDANPECAEHYGLRTSKGYGTKVHRDGLGTYGAHELHRRTFIRNYVPAEQSMEKPVVVIRGYTRKQGGGAKKKEDDACLVVLPTD